METRNIFITLMKGKYELVANDFMAWAFYNNKIWSVKLYLKLKELCHKCSKMG